MPLTEPSNALGFTLIEVMVAVALGLVVMAAMTSVFVSSSAGRNEVERGSRQIENGRYALQLIADDLRQAGYYAEFEPSILPTPAAKPNPCATDVASLKAAMPLQIQGYDDAAANVLSCLADVRQGSDIVVIRRTSACAVGGAGCDAVVAGAPYFQASLCFNGAELNGPVTGWYGLSTDTSTLTLHNRNCATVAALHRYLTRIYFIANNDVAGDGVPTLKMAELGAGAFTIVPLVEGVEQMQIEYGIDTNADGAPNAFTTNPDTFNGCAGAACMTNWRNAVAAKLHLLVRNTQATPGYVDAKVYTLGASSVAPGVTQHGGTGACASASLCYPTGYRRHVYETDVRLNNPSGRLSTS